MNLSIKNVPDTLVEQLRLRAKRNHRSLQGELLSILEQTLHPRTLKIEEARASLESLSFQTDDEAQAMIRADRDGR